MAGNADDGRHTAGLKTGNGDLCRQARCRIVEEDEMDWTVTYQTQARVEALFENGMGWLENELGEQDLVAALVDLSYGCRSLGQLTLAEEAVTA